MTLLNFLNFGGYSPALSNLDNQHLALIPDQLIFVQEDCYFHPQPLMLRLEEEGISNGRREQEERITAACSETGEGLLTC